MIALGYNPSEFDDHDNPPEFMPVRKSWPTKGAPAWKIDEDVCFFQVTEQDDMINRQRHSLYNPKDNDNVIKTTVQTRVIRVSWIFYGPNSFDNAFILKNALFEAVKENLNQNELYLIPNITSPRRAPELFSGQWWERVDFEALFNERIKLESNIPYIKSAEFKIIDQRGEETDVVINP